MCPVCRTPMVAFEMDGVEVDRCVECGGTWLDAGEFISIAGLEDDPADSFSEATELQGVIGHIKNLPATLS